MYHPSPFPSQVSTDNPDPHAERIPILHGPRRLSGEDEYNAQLPQSTLQNKPGGLRIEQRYPSLALPPKPSWLMADAYKTVVPKSELISQPMVTASGDARSPMAQELSFKEQRTSKRKEDFSETQLRPLKRDRDVEEGREDELAAYKRRRLKNNYYPEDSWRLRGSTTSRNDKLIPVSSVKPHDRRDADPETTIEELRNTVSHLERSLHKEKTEATSLRQELDEERRKRRNADLIIENIRREMKAPFIAPNLLDAFINFANISNMCMEEVPL